MNEQKEKDVQKGTQKISILSTIAMKLSEFSPVEMTNLGRTIFRSFLATILVIGGGYFLYKIALIHETTEVKLNEYVGVIIGYIAGLLTAAVSFYFGGQDRSKKTGKEVDNIPTE
jgi:uncharacterized YccA/Bax inhibitor family protein